MLSNECETLLQAMKIMKENLNNHENACGNVDCKDCPLNDCEVCVSDVSFYR